MKRLEGLAPATVALVFALGALNAFGAASGKLPRYSLEPGLHLKYESSAESKDKDGKNQFKTTGVAEFWVLSSAQPLGWQLFAVMTDVYVSDGENASSSVPQISVGLVTLNPDGTYECSDQLRFAEGLAPFIPLPKTVDEAEKGWSSAADLVGATAHFVPTAALADAERLWALNRTNDGPMEKVYGITRSENIVFDVRANLVSAIEGTFTQGYDIQSQGTSNTKLSLVEKIDAQKLATLRECAPQLVKALEDYTHSFGDAAVPSGQLRDHVTKAFDNLRRAAEPITLDAVTQLIVQRTKELDGTLRYAVDATKAREAMVGKAASDWNLRGLDGASNSLSDFKGKVVLLDFWYRGCGWCIRAMPQLSALATAYKDKPLVVLGMNVDENEADAKFVADTMHLPYITLLGGAPLNDDSIAKKYQVHIYPTLVLIDKTGKVNEILNGYSPRLREELSRKIDALL